MTWRAVIGLTVVCLLSTGCVPDLSPWEVQRGPFLGDGGPPPTGTCSRALFGNAISGSSGGCYFDEQITGEDGWLEYPCEGGAARVTFGEHVYTGSYAEGVVDVSLSTRYPYGGCDWITQQRITGSPTAGRLDYSYYEMLAPGQSGCGSPCTGSAVIDVR